MKQLADWQREETDSRELMRAFPELALDEVYVFTPKGEVKNLPGGLDTDRLRLLRAHRRRPPHRRREGERPHRPAPLPPAERRLRRDPDVEADGRGPSRDWLSLAVSSRAEQDPPVVQPRDA